MVSMSLQFILCDSETTSAPRTRNQNRKNTKKRSSSTPEPSIDDTLSAKTNDQKDIARPRKSRGTIQATDRQQHVRELQNRRQRRYRERKKSTASALQATADQLLLENTTLESDILQYFKSQMQPE